MTQRAHTLTIKGHKEGKKEPKTKGKGKHNVGNVVVQSYPRHVYHFMKTWPVGFKISKHRVKFKSVDKLQDQLEDQLLLTRLLRLVELDVS